VRLNEVSAVLADHLLVHDPAPVAVAFSGGGDSLALLLAAHGWAQASGRPLLALTVDHGLQAQSAAWAEACAEVARRLDVAHRTLRWTGPKPGHGLPAAARAARHQLLAEAARASGARVLLLGHTADDVAEARVMRAAGSTVPEPRRWSPSPAWPEGRGLFLLRPLIGQSRAAIRGWLRDHGQAWIDDPANADLRYARPRARAALGGAEAPPPAEPSPDVAPLARACRMDAGGGLAMPRDRLRAAAPAAARRFLAAACLCAAGTTRPPRSDRLARLHALASSEACFATTLAGARIEGDAAELRFLREAGEAARGGLAAISLTPGAPAVWDGRFEATADRPGLTLAALAGRRTGLSDMARRGLATLPARGRGALPALLLDDGTVSCPLLEPAPEVALRPLVLDRLLAACGAVAREAA
jgi:tRNA(Ile)-lysidine synthase